MGSSGLKEEFTIVQTAPGGGNKASARTSELKYHASMTNILLGVIGVFLFVGTAYEYEKCKKTHKNWMWREIVLSDLQKSAREHMKV